MSFSRFLARALLFHQTSLLEKVLEVSSFDAWWLQRVAHWACEIHFSSSLDLSDPLCLMLPSRHCISSFPSDTMDESESEDGLERRDSPSIPDGGPDVVECLTSPENLATTSPGFPSTSVNPDCERSRSGEVRNLRRVFDRKFC